MGRSHELPIEGWESAHVLTPDDILGGVTPKGPVLVFDDDHYYIGGIVAEALRRAGCEVRLITPAGYVSAWTRTILAWCASGRFPISSGKELRSTLSR